MLHQRSLYLYFHVIHSNRCYPISNSQAFLVPIWNFYVIYQSYSLSFSFKCTVAQDILLRLDYPYSFIPPFLLTHGFLYLPKQFISLTETVKIKPKENTKQNWHLREIFFINEFKTITKAVGNTYIYTEIKSRQVCYN